jgi:uncharacterized membrane protein YwaF
MPKMPRQLVREGMVAGLLGGLGVAVWFFIVDTVAGRPFATPIALGQATFSLLGPDIAWSPTTYVVAYTLLHFAVFLAFGAIIGVILQASKRTPGVLAGLLILFGVFEAGFHFFSRILAQPGTIEPLAWYQIGAANLVAAALMGWYLFRKNPELKQRFDDALVGTSS